MPLGHHYSFTMLLALYTFLAPAMAQTEEPEPELNLAQTLIFRGDHLQQIHQGQTVIYDFTRQAPGQPEMTDEIRMTITKVNEDASRDLIVEFLSGADRLPFPAAQNYRGNPVTIQFLERDIKDLSETIGDPIGYYRNRIRKSFGDPQIEKVRVQVNNMELDAVQITVTPFKTDPNVAHMEGYADKVYRFVYSDQVPGHLVSIFTRVPLEGGAALEEELRFNRMIDTAL